MYSPNQALILFRNGTQHTAGIAHCHHIIGNVVGHNAACADHHIAADGHTGHHHAVTAKPDIITHGDGSGIFQQFIAGIFVNRVVYFFWQLAVLYGFLYKAIRTLGLC
jgi:hypothetical protein